MKKTKKKIISFLMIIIIFINTFIYSNAATNVSVSVINNPKIDIALTIKDTQLDLTNFEADIRKSLQNKGIDTSNIKFQTVDGGKISTDELDAETVLNTWGRVGKTGSWSLVGSGDSAVIQNKENTVGMTGFYYKDNFKLKDMTLEFDAKPIDSDNDYFGIFLRFNVEDESVANTSKKVTSYMYIEQKNGATDFKTANGLYRLIGKTLLTADDSGSSQSSKLGGVIQQVSSGWTATTSSFNHYKFTIEGNHITGYRDGTKIIDYTDTSTNAINTGSFGFVNWSQPAQFKNFVAKYTVFRSYSDILYDTKWQQDSVRLIVNVDDTIDETLTGEDTIGEISSRTLEDGIHFIQWGTNTNKASSEAFIARNDNKGKFTYNTNYSQAVEDTANYIKGLIEQEKETQTVIVGQPTTLIVSPAEYKTNATSTDFPNGRWKIVHDDTHFKNSMGKESDLITPNLNCTFNKTGKYTIYFDNQPVKEIYVHRKPVADFDIGLSNGKVTLDSISYDLDTDTNIGLGSGIKSEQWYYKTADATSWTPGKMTSYTSGVYLLRLDVTDYQNETTSAIKYIGTGNPVAKFTYLNNPVGKYKTLEIKNTSYDPQGVAIKSYNWTLKKDGVEVGTYTSKTPLLTFKELGVGNYSYTLIVTNENNISSEPFTNSFTVIDDIDKPTISITPTSCTWKGYQGVTVTINDTESGFGKFKYISTTSQTFPADSAAWKEVTTNGSTINVTGTTTGEYYLHIQGYDAAGNKETKTVGKYQIDKTPPVINNIAQTKNGVNKTNLTVSATDAHTELHSYAISTTSTQPTNFQTSNVLTATQLGTHYVWAKDTAGNISYTTYNVTLFDFAITTNCNNLGAVSEYSIVSAFNATSISIIPSVGYKIKDVIVDGTSVGPTYTYDFWDVTSNHTIIATFERDTKITTILNNLKTKYDWITFK